MSTTLSRGAFATATPGLRWQIGAITVDRVVESEKPALPARIIFPTAPAEAVQRYKSVLGPRLFDPASEFFILSLHSFIVRTRHHTIVVDACAGNDKERPAKPHYHRNQGPYLERFRATGVRLEDVDFVFCTHLHIDHVGWNTRLENGRWVPTFPNARYLFARTEWDHWKNEATRRAYATDPYFEDSVLPIVERGQAEFVASDYHFEDSIWLEPSPGHTPGHSCVRLQSEGRAAVMSGDLIHHPVQCFEPEWSSGFCTDPQASARTRRVFLDRHAETDTLIMPAHFPTPAVGWVRRAGAAFRFAFDGE
jgi:glyoxylase-like metal-dependent hydrolase (beta-lactamase superfamily II)